MDSFRLADYPLRNDFVAFNFDVPPWQFVDIL
jgi:hypothetical protein